MKTMGNSSCESVDDYDYTDEEIISSGNIAWMRAPDFRQTLKAVHLISDIVPYWCQIVQLLAMAIERYILICKATSSNQLLSKRRRKTFYTIVVLLSFLIPALIFAEYVYYEIDKVMANFVISCF